MGENLLDISAKIGRSPPKRAEGRIPRHFHRFHLRCLQLSALVIINCIHSSETFASKIHRKSADVSIPGQQSCSCTPLFRGCQLLIDRKSRMFTAF